MSKSLKWVSIGILALGFTLIGHILAGVAVFVFDANHKWLFAGIGVGMPVTLICLMWAFWLHVRQIK